MGGVALSEPGVDTPGPAGVRPVSERLIYFSSTSENTHRFVGKLGRPAARLPLHTSEETLKATGPYVLVVPTYGAGGVGHVPKQVIKFLNVPDNRHWCRGVIAAGNSNFGGDFCLAGDIIARKLGVPYLYRFELMGTPEDVARVTQGLDELWKRQSSSSH